MRIPNMLRAAAFSALTCTASLSAAVTPVNSNLMPEAREILDYFDSIHGTRTIAGTNLYGLAPNTYTHIGKRGGLWNRDLNWFLDQPDLSEERINQHIQDWNDFRPILSLQWHWKIDGKSAWETDVNMAQLVTEGTALYNRMIAELDEAATVFQQFEDAGVPIVWRPLHEIDQGHFWWTDEATPENTAELYRIVFRRLTNYHGLNNLIWVYNVINSGKPPEERARFFPGASFVDIMSADIYKDAESNAELQQEYWDFLESLAPGKMKALAECHKMPDPALMQSGEMPRWLYALPWIGTPMNAHPFDWALETYNHPLYLTLDELPRFGNANVRPEVGVVTPNGSGRENWFIDTNPQLEVFAKDRGNAMQKVEFYANGIKIGQDSSDPFKLNWNASPGIYQITAKGYSSDGSVVDTLNAGANWDQWYNYSWVTVGYEDLSWNLGESSYTASSQFSQPSDQFYFPCEPHLAFDGDYTTQWISAKIPASDTNRSDWLQVDLGSRETISKVVVRFGWSVPIDFNIQVSNNGSNWTNVYTVRDFSWFLHDGEEVGQPGGNEWALPFICDFEPVEARFVRFKALDIKPGGSDRYEIVEIEVPVLAGDSGVDPGDEVILDNIAADGFVNNGFWTQAWGDYLGANWNAITANTSRTQTAQWNLSGFNGSYTIYYRASGGGRASNQKVQIAHAGGTANRTINLDVANGTWVPVGTFNLNSSSVVKALANFTPTGSGTRAIADAIKLVGDGGGSDPGDDPVDSGPDSESFSSMNQASLGNGSFIGDAGFQWSYTNAAHKDNGISGRSWRSKWGGSTLSASIPGGLTQLRFKFMNSSTSGTAANYGIYVEVNGSPVAGSPFILGQMDQARTVTISLPGTGSSTNVEFINKEKLTLIDDISWEGGTAGSNNNDSGNNDPGGSGGFTETFTGVDLLGGGYWTKNNGVNSTMVFTGVEGLPWTAYRCMNGPNGSAQLRYSGDGSLQVRLDRSVSSVSFKFRPEYGSGTKVIVKKNGTIVQSTTMNTDSSGYATFNVPNLNAASDDTVEFAVSSDSKNAAILDDIQFE